MLFYFKSGVFENNIDYFNEVIRKIPIVNPVSDHTWERGPNLPRRSCYLEKESIMYSILRGGSEL